MSWSLKILVLYLGFVALILTLVFTCFGHKTELEYKDYYTRELNFQEQLIAQENANKLRTPIEHNISGNVVELIFPEEIRQDLSGTVELLRPSDSSKDLSIPLAPGPDGHQSIGHLQKGVYKMRVRVEQHGKKYFKEAVITIR